MRDRLEELVQEAESEGEWECRSEDEEEEEVRQEAVVFEESGELEEVLREAQAMRRELAELQQCVERVRGEASRCAGTVRRLSAMQRSSSALGAGVRRRGEALLRRLAALEQRREELERRHGAHAALPRIARAQHAALGHALRHALASYAAAEEEQRQRTRQRLQRQAEILGRAVSGPQLDRMLQEGGWGAFSQDLHPEGMTARCAFRQVRERHRQLLELEERLRLLQQLFLDMGVLVQEQGAALDSIEAHVLATHDYLDTSNLKFKTAIQYRRRNPCLKMCCGCFPCWKQATG